MNSVFFLKNGEGNDIETDTFEGEDLFGWLVPSDRIDSFEKEWLNGTPSNEWNENLTWAEWEMNGK